MSDIAIRVEGLGKRYRIGARQERYRTLREALTERALLPFRAMKSLSGSKNHNQHSASSSNSQSEIRKSKSGTIWALKDVSIQVKRGEVVGIIGRNGAGKSTLLKILASITEPTEGYADICGRVGSLLEVGTGFHPELTGRENLFLNGAILGMKRGEITKRFDDIVSFAEVERFIDTPVKRYSSGMYLRLAFAVAAHLEPEILLVDEVLAVGDAMFQKKCLGKIGDVAKEGRTVLFISHNMEAVLNLCERCLVLEDGRVAFSGASQESVKFYHEGSKRSDVDGPPHIIHSPPSLVAQPNRITRIEVFDELGDPKPILSTWDNVVFRVHYTCVENIQNGSMILELRDYKDQRLIVLDSGLQIPLKKGEHYIDCFVDHMPLAAGEYFLGAGLAFSNSQWIWRETNMGSVHVNGSDVFKLGRPPVYSRMMIAANHRWR